MTDQEIDALKEGRELDALVATAIGLPVVWGPEPYMKAGQIREGRFPFLKGTANGCNYDWAAVPNYSTSIADAFTVLDAWQGDYEIRRQNGHYRVELFKPSQEWEEWAATLSLAIARASLKAARTTTEAGHG
jgi:hypothetical protein